MYHPAAGALASWIVQVPMMFLLAAASLIPMFVIGDLHWPSFPMVWLVYAVTFWAFEGMAQLNAIAPNVNLALELSPHPHRTLTRPSPSPST